MVVGAQSAAKIVAAVAVLCELAECHALLAGCDYTLRSLCAARTGPLDGWWLPVTVCQCNVKVMNLATLPTIGCATGVEMRAAITAAPHSI